MKIDLEKFICDIIDELCFYPECRNVSAAINDALKDQGFICNNGHILKLELNQEWIEEDEKYVDDLIANFTADMSLKHTEGDIVNWLESLKDRVQLQSKKEWSKEDKKIISEAEMWLDTLCDYLKDSSPAYIPDVRVVISKLKSFRPQNSIVTDEELAQAKKDAYNDALDKIEYHSDTPTFDDGWSAAIWYLKKRNAMPQSQWKPSDEQMENLSRTFNSGTFRTSLLMSLYQDLKKLREE